MAFQTDAFQTDAFQQDGEVAEFGSALPALLGESSGTEYYCDPVNGNDANDGLSVGAAKETLPAVFALVVNGQGDIVNLRSTGVYEGAAGATLDVLFPVGVYGPSAANPITIRTYPPDLTSETGLPGTRGEAVIRGRLQFNPGDLKLQNYNGGNGFNMRIQNLEIKDAPGSGEAGIDGIKTNNAQNFEISGCYIHDCGGMGCLIRGAGRSTTLSAGIDADDTTLTVASNANFLEATPFYAVLGNGDGVEIVQVTDATTTTWTVVRGQLGTSGAAHTSGRTVEGYWQLKNVQIFNCIIGDCGDGSEWSISHAHPIYWGSDNGFAAGHGGAIYNCILYNSDPAIGGAYAINCYEQGDDSIIANVTVYGMRRGGVTVSGQDVHATDDSTWKNLIIAHIGQDDPGPGYAMDSFFTGDFGPGSGNLFDCVLWWDAFLAHRTGADALGVTWTNITNDDPEFYNSATLDFRLPDTSPAVGIGDPDYTPPLDIRGTARVTADLGALASEPPVEPPVGSATGPRRMALRFGLGL